jgi:mRNA interferase MazF
VVLSDQVKSLDWKIRKAKFKDKVILDVLVEVSPKAKSLLSIS